MTTSEGQVKARVKALLARYDIRPAKDAGKFSTAAGWYFWAASSGFGTKGVPDVVGHYRGRFFAIETKAPGKKPSGFQALQIEALRASGVEVFVVDGEGSLRVFEAWLESVHRRNNKAPENGRGSAGLIDFGRST